MITFVNLEFHIHNFFFFFLLNHFFKTTFGLSIMIPFKDLGSVIFIYTFFKEI